MSLVCLFLKIGGVPTVLVADRFEFLACISGWDFGKGT
jgi:hypothetical protein